MDQRTKISHKKCAGWGCGQKSENGCSDKYVTNQIKGGSDSFHYEGTAQFTSDVIEDTCGSANHVHPVLCSAVVEAEECYGWGRPFFCDEYKL